MRSLLAAARLTIFFLSGLVTIAYQTVVLSLTKGPIAFAYPKAYHAFCARLMGIKTIVEGDIVRGQNVVYVGNHISYFDVQVLGGVLPAAFVAKKDIENWPFFGILGKMGRTLYISRNPADAQESTTQMLERLDEPCPLVIFTEGTSSRGTSILPFKSSLFEIFLNRDLVIQPFTISLLEINGQKTLTDAIRDEYTWHGDMDLLPHLWHFAKGKGAVVKVVFQKSLLASEFKTRKELSNVCYEAVVRGLDLSASPPYGHSLDQPTITAETRRSVHANQAR